MKTTERWGKSLCDELLKRFILRIYLKQVSDRWSVSWLVGPVQLKVQFSRKTWTEPRDRVRFYSTQNTNFTIVKLEEETA